MTAENIAAVLAEFRTWLEQAAAGVAGTEFDAPADRPPPDLHSLLGELVALRQEVNLQTRAVRNQQEQNGEALRQLTQIVEVYRDNRRVADPPGSGADESQRPLLKTLVDVFDALNLAQRELRRLQSNVWSAVDQLTENAADAGRDVSVGESQARSGFWSGLFGGRRQRAPTAPAAPAATHDMAAQVRRKLESMITGYGMSVERIERALQQHGLEPILCDGQPFDPERMEVVEVVRTNDRPAGEVIEEVRRGFVRDGRVFRCAQVRVAKPLPMEAEWKLSEVEEL